MADDGDLAAIRDWAGKAVGAAMRIAGLMHMAEHLRDGYTQPISGQTAANAVRIIEYYTVHALVAFDAMSTDETIVRARVALDWIERTEPDRFTSRQHSRPCPETASPRLATGHCPESPGTSRLHPATAPRTDRRTRKARCASL